MKKILSFLAIALVTASVFAAAPSTDRRSMAGQWASAPRATTASTKQLTAMAGITVDKSSTQPIVVEEPKPAPVVDREHEKQACINNNIGVGNTFVWASRYSNTGNYASMIEDTQNPENNTCFVKVELKSDDSRINVSDIAPVYYEMGRTITCGSWTDEGKIKQRILDAKKSARTWGTVAGAVGGAGVGVGAMELFGNRLIGGSVMGQKDMSESERLRSQLLTAKEKGSSDYDDFKRHLGVLKAECDKFDTDPNFAGATKPTECTSINYEALLLL